jgi:hypothetical protein
MKNMPVFRDHLMSVTDRLSFCRDGATVFYFFDGLPVFSHQVRDVISFHMITASFCVRGYAEQAEIVHAFGADPEGVRLAVELYRDMGADGFYPQRARVSASPKPPSVGKKRRPKKT